MLDFLIPSLLLGFGISIDIAIATIAFYKLFPTFKSGLSWGVKVTLTHTIFPMFGYYSFAAAARVFPWFIFWLGLVATALIVWHLIDAFKSLKDGAEHESNKNLSIHWVVVIAVSWDALLAGPAKSAQALSWTPHEVFWSFVIAGIAVATTSCLSLIIATTINKKSQSEIQLSQVRSKPMLWASWLQFSTIGYFGLMAAFRYMLGVNWPWPSILILSLCFWACIFLLTFSRGEKAGSLAL